jgi:iron-sulfur cluster assembly protein
VVEQEGAVLFIEPTAIMYLLGTEMDFKTDKLASQFVFNNPNQTGACGCGESVNLEPAAEASALAHGD